MRYGRHYIDKELPLKYHKSFSNDTWFEPAFKTPHKILVDKGIHINWKEAYFNTVFSLTQGDNYNIHGFTMDHYEKHYNDCKCVHFPRYHYIHDLLYGINRYTSIKLFRCFIGDTACIHGVSHCTRTCPQLTPVCYYDIYELSPIITVPHVLDILVHTCKVFPKHLNVSKFGKVYKECPQDHLGTILKSVESLLIEHTHVDDVSFQTEEVLRKIIFENKKISVVEISDTEHDDSHTIFNTVYPYLIDSLQNKLKQVTIFLDNYTQNLSKQFSSIFQNQPGLEKVKIYFGYLTKDPFNDQEFTQCITDLMLRPMLKELTFSCELKRFVISVDVLIPLLRQFFSSVHPIKLSLSLSCPEFEPITEVFPVNIDQSLKSLEFKKCAFSSDLSSLLPSHLVLKSLTLTDSFDDAIIKALTNLKSINISDTFTFVDSLRHDNISNICILFNIVTAAKWDITIKWFDEDIIDPATINCLRRIKGTITSFKFDCHLSIPILEAIFLSLSPFKPPYFLLGLHYYYHYLDENTVKTIHSIWKASGGVKLKTILLYTRDMKIKEISPQLNFIKHTLSDMALEISTTPFVY